ADAVETEEQIEWLVDASPVPVSVNMGLGLRSRPTTPLISVARLAELGVKRVTLPRMLPAAAILGMRRALKGFAEGRTSREPYERPDLVTDIDDIWTLMGEADVASLEAKYLSFEGL